MQHEITGPAELLDASGRIAEEGFSRLPHQRYRRDRIHAPWWRIKEWDYYAVLDQSSGFGVTLTASDLGYAGLFALCLVDLSTGVWEQVDTLSLFPRGETGFAGTADEEHLLSFSDKKLNLAFERTGDRRLLRFSSDAFLAAGGPVSGEITLQQHPDVQRMVIATSWAQKRTAFYFNQKINCMPASGSVRIGAVERRFSDDTSFGVLDWGRGNWTYRNRWYWASASGVLPDGNRFGFNLGYGFSDRTPASENVLFFGGTVHKLSEVTFHIDTKDYLAPWRFTDDDGRLELDFAPALDRNSTTDLLLIKSVQHQCFGYYSGTVVLDDGKPITIERFPGFAEDVYNRW